MVTARQSLKPPRAALIAVGVVVVVFAIVWGSISLATGGTKKETCQTSSSSVPYNGETIPAEADKCQ